MMTGEEFLALSDERDMWMRWVGQAWRDGHLAGREDGYRDGYAQAVTDWKVTMGVVGGGPSYAELDRHRHPPGGRVSWIIVRADKGERCAHEVARVPCPDDCQEWAAA
jgi:hypothetical protein